MTNAQKFLKDGVDIENFTNSLCRFVENWELRNGIKNFLKKEVKPTLTADERVILRNIPTKYWQKICRDNYGVLEIRGESEEIDFHTDNISDFDEYNHLFQFIKERRRILY